MSKIDWKDFNKLVGCRCVKCVINGKDKDGDIPCHLCCSDCNEIIICAKRKKYIKKHGIAITDPWGYLEIICNGCDIKRNTPKERELSSIEEDSE